MDFQPLYREVRLSLLDENDVRDALAIIRGNKSVSQVAESVSQEYCSFDGDGDILVISYLRDIPASDDEARKVLGAKGDEFVTKQLIPALVCSTAPIELVLRYCNLSAGTILKLATAIKENSSLVGFNIHGNPGNNESTRSALKYACIETMAPIQWFQGQFLTGALADARQELANRRMVSTLGDDSLSPRTKVAELRRIQHSVEPSEESVEEIMSKGKKPLRGNDEILWSLDRHATKECDKDEMDKMLSKAEMSSKIKRSIDKLMMQPPKAAMYAKQKNSRRDIPAADSPSSSS